MDFGPERKHTVIGFLIYTVQTSGLRDYHKLGTTIFNVDRVFSGAHPTISHIEGMVTPFFPLELRAARSFQKKKKSKPLPLKNQGLPYSPETTLKNRRNPTSPRDNTCQSLGLIFPFNKVLMVDPENPFSLAFEVFQTLLLHVAIFTLTGTMAGPNL